MKVKKIRFHFFRLGYAGFYWVVLGLGRFGFVELGTCVKIFIGRICFVC